jgi:hypothetical protein
MTEGLAMAGWMGWRNGLLVVLVLFMGIVVLFWLTDGGSGSEPALGDEQATVESPPPGGFLPETADASFTGAAPAARTTQADKTLALIDDYERKLSNDPPSPETPALLMATGNLYKTRLGDCSRAAYYYRTLITEYPETPNLSQAYVQLCDCYVTLDDTRALRLMCREMLDHFPPESQEYQYARSVLDQN